ncbi:MAG: alpha/beta hydrolase [Acidobacteriaceae bacterium]
MKVLRFIATLGFVVAGILLLVAPSHAAAFAPTRFTVVDAGTVGKPDVILIPGLSSSRSVWDAEVKLLAPNYRLHVVQVDGFAGAPAGPNATGPMVPGIVDELHQYIVASKMHPVVIGHSLGGLMTLMLADAHPEDVSKIVIVDSLPFYGMVFDPSVTVGSLAPQANAIHAQVLAMPADQFAAMQPMMVKAMVKDEAGGKAVAASSIASDRAVFANAMLEDLQTDIRPEMAKIKTPALLLYPFDSTVPGADVAKFDALYKGAYAAMPNVKLVRIDDSRHFIMYDQPAKFDAAVETFLK